MAYSDFTLPDLTEKFGLTVREGADLFAVTPEAPPPAVLIATLARYLPLALDLGNEKARSELVIAPVLVEFKLQHKDRVSLFTGIEFNEDREAGLVGRFDFLLARGPSQLMLTGPVCVVVEAKNENILAGIPQCLAGMIAARRFNARVKRTGPVYGVVTTGEQWRFLRLDGDVADIDVSAYPVQDLAKLFGILTAIAL